MWCILETGEVHTGLWWRNMRERDHLEDLGIEGRIILIRIFRTWGREHELASFGTGQGQVMGSVSVVMNFWVPYNVGNSLTS
jgi:hypothetical protein